MCLSTAVAIRRKDREASLCKPCTTIGLGNPEQRRKTMNRPQKTKPEQVIGSARKQTNFWQNVVALYAFRYGAMEITEDCAFEVLKSTEQAVVDLDRSGETLVVTLRNNKRSVLQKLKACWQTWNSN
jgi:hypothetical protein